MEQLPPPDGSPPERERRARRKNADPTPPPPVPSSRYRRPGKDAPRTGKGSVRAPAIDHALHAAPLADAASARLSYLVIEMAGLLEGAMRWLAVGREGLASHAAAADPAGSAGVCQPLDEATAALVRVAELMHTAMRPCAGPLGEPEPGARTARDAFEHAAVALAPLAKERGVRIDVEFADSLGGAPAGGLYAVASAALRNAIEACGPGGVAHFRASLAPTGSGKAEVRAEIIDDGVGPPPDAEERAFEHGYTTKPGRKGMGLALARDILREMGGTIELRTRMDGARRRGALLSFRCPIPLAA